MVVCRPIGAAPSVGPCVVYWCFFHDNGFRHPNIFQNVDRQCNAAGDRPDIGNVISLQNHEIEKLAIFIYDTVHNEPNTLI
jgi:hypothetical protein